MIASVRPFRFISVLALLPAVGVAGTIVVQVRDPRAQMVEEAVVYAIAESHAGAVPARATAVMDQKDRMFIPHVLAIQTGTAVEFPNSDDIRHHVYSFSSPKPFQLPLYSGTPANPVVFDKPGVVALGCNIHDRMSAFIVVVDTPHFGKTDARGKVELHDVPPGRYSVRMWHTDEQHQPAPVTVSVVGDERHELAFTTGDRPR